MKKSNLSGSLFFLIHFLLEVTSFYVLTTYIKSPCVWGLTLLYDFVAFALQGFFGYLRDRGIRLNLALIGTALTSLSIVLLIFDLYAFIVISVLSLGNCLVHVHGAGITLRASPGKIFPSALFVAGGSFGVVIGKLLSMRSVAAPWILCLTVLSFIPIIITERMYSSQGDENLIKYGFSNDKINTAAVIIMATFVVAVRSYMGYGIPTAWNNTELSMILLYFCMGIGKALGGLLTDRIGIRLTAVISTVGALPFLIFGANVMAVSLIGVTFFSMTMAVTLAVIVSRLQKYPGVAFGFTTFGLFLGTLPFFFFRITSAFVNNIVISLLTVPCAVILFIICRKNSRLEKP